MVTTFNLTQALPSSCYNWPRYNKLPLIYFWLSNSPQIRPDDGWRRGFQNIGV